MANEEALHNAVVAWLAAVIDAGADNAFVTDAATRVPEWAVVVDRIAAIATPERRPELWSKPDSSEPRLQALQLLRDTGLSAAWRAADRIAADEVASSFVAAVRAPSPQVETWWLTDLDLRAGTRIGIGDYVLETTTRERLIGLAPLPPAYDVLPARHRIDADLFQGSAFLHHRSHDAPARGVRVGYPTGRPELRIWRPLLALMLWRREVVRVEASWAVEPRRRIDVLHDDATIGYFGREAVEGHQRGSYEASDDSSVDALAAFTTTVDACVAKIVEVPSRKPTARARRLQRSAEHLVRATQRSFSTGEPRDEGERDEILLHYVIGIEGLLAGKEEELTRRVTQRAAALFPTDDDRVLVEDTVKQAYKNRSLYAHGDETKDYDLTQIREVALAVALRWTVLQAAEPDAEALLPRLDRSLISENVRRAQVVEPLEALLDGLVVPSRTLQHRWH